MVLPAFGLMLEILPVFARKPLFIYRWVVVSFWAIVILSCIVWAHHLFTSGMWALLNFPFMITTELISVPTGIVFLSALGTIWRGSIRITPAFLFAASVVANFMIGGLTGIFWPMCPTDLHMHDTLFVTAHFHFTIVGAAIFALFAGFYFGSPKFTGKTMNEKWGMCIFGVFSFLLTLLLFPCFGPAPMGYEAEWPITASI
jgi:cytochrome c oxidase subunit 1